MSNTLILQEHPSLIVEEIAARYGADLTFTYSRYMVAPSGLQAAAPRSSVLRVSARDISLDWLADRLAELGPMEEMALHSWVECRGVGCHIPMIDFIGRPTHQAICNFVRALMTDVSLSSRLVLFDTGQSFHGYFPDLISEQAWPKYLGQLLLFDDHDQLPIIDKRWVGHALVRGFTALRWSHNTNRYRAMPHLISDLHR